MNIISCEKSLKTEEVVLPVPDLPRQRRLSLAVTTDSYYGDKSIEREGICLKIVSNFPVVSSAESFCTIYLSAVN